MIKLQNYDITFTTINTRMVTEIFNQKLRVDSVLFNVPNACFLDIR